MNIKMNRVQSEFEVWGTVVYLECASSTASIEQLQHGVDLVQDFCHEVDEVFSTYKNQSQISRLRRGEMRIEECDERVKEVWGLCVQARELSDGAFDPWAVAGGFDPSGLVKGWAADKSADILLAAGAQHIHMNAAGDLALRGGFFDETTQSVQPWSIGVVNPDNNLEVVQIFTVTDGAIATSGTYERGAHITDPYTGMIAIGAQSATIVGPNGALCDALATAVMVAGKDSAIWFSQSELSEYRPWVIERHENLSWSI
jgi:FAD:protein FMN transferase